MSDMIDKFFALSQIQRVGFVVYFFISIAALVYLLNVCYTALKSLIFKVKTILPLLLIYLKKVASLIFGILLLPIFFIVQIIKEISAYLDHKRKQRIIEDTLLVEKTRAEFRDKSKR